MKATLAKAHLRLAGLMHGDAAKAEDVLAAVDALSAARVALFRHHVQGVLQARDLIGADAMHRLMRRRHGVLMSGEAMPSTPVHHGMGMPGAGPHHGATVFRLGLLPDMAIPHLSLHHEMGFGPAMGMPGVAVRRRVRASDGAPPEMGVHGDGAHRAVVTATAALALALPLATTCACLPQGSPGCA